MNSYKIARPFVFALPPERAHQMALSALRFQLASGLLRLQAPPEVNPVTLAGLRFSNPVGLAAGLDKDGEAIDALGALGFGFIEIGTVTPKPQEGNPKPRLFRLKDHRSVINRMGFNNQGVDALVERVRKRRYTGILGVNIGKNKDTPLDNAVDDYVYCFDRVHEVADYITANVSSPNTQGLRDLQSADHLTALLSGLKSRQEALQGASGRYVPLFIKIAPDLDERALDETCEVLAASGVDAVIATNTTVSRDGVTTSRYAKETGGLSGAALRTRSNDILSAVNSRIGDRVPLIGVGGISRPEDVHAKFERGASLVQIYTGLIYEGPGLVRELIDGLDLALIR